METKYCRFCQAEHPATREFWYLRKGRPASCKESRREYLAKWRVENADRIRDSFNHWRERNTERFKVTKAKWASDNKHRTRERVRKWIAENPRQHAINNIMTHNIKITPPWADKQAIRDFYWNCPPGYHVDHIIPKNGKNVSGLHVLENLQYLPADDNMRKSNKIDDIMLSHGTAAPFCAIP